MDENKKVLLSLKNVDVKFNVRGRILTAIRNVSLDIYENESIAIVGESGSGKSVLTKTFAGMLDSNGFISNGSIILSDDELANTVVEMNNINSLIYKYSKKTLDKYSYLEFGSSYKNEMFELKEAFEHEYALNDEEADAFNQKAKAINDDIIDCSNYIQTLDKSNAQDKAEFLQKQNQLAELRLQLKQLNYDKENLIKTRKINANTNLKNDYKAKVAILKDKRNKAIANAKASKALTQEVLDRNELLAKEIVLSIGRYPLKAKIPFLFKILKAFKRAMIVGLNIVSSKIRNKIFEAATFRVKYLETLPDGSLKGYAIIDCAKVKYTNDWQQIRGKRIATVFQDPMTSLNPIVTIGKQIMTVILKHQNCTYEEAKTRALDIMSKVGIPDPKKRFNDYPFQYSGGMRQRIVIAIALSCQPKILICDEPTTALDVTIQAQIIRLIRDLQKELGFTTVYITHDLGVVANVAERVAVLYGGQIVELGTVEDIFYNPRHPYTWALLSSLPQLSERGTELFSIQGTPPSLYNKIVGDAFAPRNKYCMAIDLVKEPPMFAVNEHHWAKTWLLDPRAPKIEKPDIICNLHEKMLKAYKNVL